MKIKSLTTNHQLLSTRHMKKLGLNWQELFSPSLAIHANRELNMSKIKLIGFDMDYTLAIYKKLPMESLQYDLARNYLIQNMSYPEELKKSSFDQTLLIRGLVIDKHLGNILKLDDQNYVWRASHCKRFLTPEQITNFYGSKRIKVGDNRYYSLDTFFSIPEAGLLVDTIECLYELKKNHNLPNHYSVQNSELLNFNQIFNDIRLAMDTIHSDGSLKTVIGDNINIFIERDLEIEATLRKLKKEGKKLFLLTNSTFDYTNIVMNYVFNYQNHKNRSWIDLFDLIITEAEKPAFFTENRPFQKAVTKEIPKNQEEKILLGGNIADFHRLAEVRGPEVLYVGDHIYGDVLRSKKDSLWRTCLIIKELNFDIRKALEHKSDLKELRRMQNQVTLADKHLMRLRTLLGILETRLENHQQIHTEHTMLLIDELKNEIAHKGTILQELKSRHFQLNRQIEDFFHAKWGRLFKEYQELSRFGGQVRQYACLYTDHIKNFLHYDAHHVFFAKKVKMTHEFDLE